MVTAEIAFRSARANLAAANVEDAAFDAAQLLRGVTGRDWRSHPKDVLNASEQAQLSEMVRRRSAHEPLQYILGQWDFLNFTVAVGPGVLIPRADTECVAETAITAAKAAGSAPAVADLCSGSGVLAIAVARAVLDAEVMAVELSPEAFSYLTRNTALLAPRVRTVCADALLWPNTLAPASLDVIVCNPPYVSSAEMAALAPELAFEPRMALEAADDGLAFYKALAPACRHALKAGGALVFEIGSTQGEAVAGILTQAGYTDVSVMPDAAGLPRCVSAKNGV